MSYKAIELAACSIINWAYADSLVELDRDRLKEQLRCDWNLTGRVPTEAECEVFVTGDDSGEIPKKLIEQFPRTHAFLNAYWQ